MTADAVRVLVVEDDAALRKVLEMRLMLEGFRVSSAEDGLAALEILESWTPDVVLTDLMMPRLDGHGLCQRIRAREDALRDLPIIVLTAYQRDAQVEALVALGGVVYMSKPFDAPTLTAALRELAAPSSVATPRAS